MEQRPEEGEQQQEQVEQQQTAEPRTLRVAEPFLYESADGAQLIRRLLNPEFGAQEAGQVDGNDKTVSASKVC